MTATRKQIFAVLFPLYDRACSHFRQHRTGLNFAHLQSIMLGMQCADAQSERILREIIENVPPERYAQVLCTYQDKRRSARVVPIRRDDYSVSPELSFHK